jgi:hypothetical protein
MPYPPYRTLGQSGPKEVAASQHEVLCPHSTPLISEGVEVGASVMVAFMGAFISTTASVGSGVTSSAVETSMGEAANDGSLASIAVDNRSTAGATDFSAKKAEYDDVDDAADAGSFEVCQIVVQGGGEYDVASQASKQLLYIVKKPLIDMSIL